MKVHHNQKHRWGTYNVQYGHPVQAHVRMIMHRFENNKLDVLALGEVADYVHELHQAAMQAGHHLVFVPGAENVINQALLVRGGCVIGRYHSINMPAVYFAPNGDVRRSSDPLVVHVDGIIYVVVHAPVQAWVAGRHGRRFLGSIRRRIAFRRYMNRLIRFCRNHTKAPIFIVGDWNTTPDSRGPFSVYWFASKVHGHLIHPGASTGHGEIDFGVGVRVKGQCHVEPDPSGLPKSDHKMVSGILETV